MGDPLGAGGPADRFQRLHVIPVPVAGHDGRQAFRPDQLEQPVGLVGRVDQQLVAGDEAAQQVDVVVEVADGHLGHPKSRHFAMSGRSAAGDVAG